MTDRTFFEEIPEDVHLNLFPIPETLTWSRIVPSQSLLPIPYYDSVFGKNAFRAVTSLVLVLDGFEINVEDFWKFPENTRVPWILSKEYGEKKFVSGAIFVDEIVLTEVKVQGVQDSTHPNLSTLEFLEKNQKSIRKLVIHMGDGCPSTLVRWDREGNRFLLMFSSLEVLEVWNVPITTFCYVAEKLPRSIKSMSWAGKAKHVSYWSYFLRKIGKCLPVISELYFPQECPRIDMITEGLLPESLRVITIDAAYYPAKTGTQLPKVDKVLIRGHATPETWKVLYACRHVRRIELFLQNPGGTIDLSQELNYCLGNLESLSVSFPLVCHKLQGCFVRLEELDLMVRQQSELTEILGHTPYLVALRVIKYDSGNVWNEFETVFGDALPKLTRLSMDMKDQDDAASLRTIAKSLIKSTQSCKYLSYMRLEFKVPLDGMTPDLQLDIMRTELSKELENFQRKHYIAMELAWSK